MWLPQSLYALAFAKKPLEFNQQDEEDHLHPISFHFILIYSISCVDIDIDDVDDSQSIYYVVVVIVNHSLLQAILFVSKW